MASSTPQKKNVQPLLEEEQELLRSKTLLQRALWRLSQDRLTLTAMAVLLFIALFSFSAPLVVRITDVDYNNPDLYNSYLPINTQVSDSTTTTWLWDGAAGEILRYFSGHTQPVIAAAYTPDGEQFITTSADGTMRLWHMASGRNKRRIEEHTAAVNGIAISPDGLTFVSASADGTAKVWQIEKPVQTDPDIPLLVFAGHSAALTSAAYHPDNKAALTGDTAGKALLWDTTSGDILLTLEAGAGAVQTVAISPDGTTLLTGHENGSLHLWDATNGEIDMILAGHENGTNRAIFTPDGTQIISAGGDSAVRIWDVESGELRHTLTGHTDAVTDLALNAEATWLLSSSLDRTVRRWNPATGAAMQVMTFDEVAENDLEKGTYPVYTVAVNPADDTFVTGTEGRRRHYVLGTDSSGRDHLTRLLFGGQVSLKIGFFAAMGSLTIGIVLGVFAGYMGGVVDDVTVWLITTLNSIPQLFLLLIISAMLAPNETSLILVLVFLGWTGATRIMRGETIALRDREFVIAARAVGASPVRIMALHISPNVISLLLIVMTRAIGGLILTESALSFLGFGVKPPTPTWGNMLTGGLDLLREAPHLVFAPGLAISITVLCLYIIGDGL
ncbi:ABC transporter permease subunit, partial [Chloroflexota bacterium]